MKKLEFSGLWTALITPMFDDGKIDYDSLQGIVEEQIASGVDGLVSVGTTGESPTLSVSEHIEVIKKTVEFANNRIPVLAGTGSNNTVEAVKYTKESEDVGADGFLMVAPYYNKPSQEGLFLHFSQIAKITKKPVMLYSIPGRCGIEISNDTVIRLYEHFENFYSIKEAGGKAEKVADLHSKSVGIDILSGDDSLLLDFFAAGAKGLVSVASNIFPKQMAELMALTKAGKLDEAKKINESLNTFFKALFIEPNPVPAKTAMAYLNMIKSDFVRLPLCKMSESNKAILLETVNAIKG